jgi:hypothetical protein
MEEIIKKWKDKLAEDKREDVYYTRELLDEMISDFKQQVKLFSLARVTQQRESFIDFGLWIHKLAGENDTEKVTKLVDLYLKSINDG